MNIDTMVTNSASDKYSNQSKHSIARQKVSELLLKSSAHGVPRLIHTKHLIFKLIWFSVLVNSAFWCSYYTIKNITHYYSYETSTTITVINENKSEFPSITLCAIPSFKTFLNESILSVVFDRQALNVREYFETFNDPVYNRCFRFNSGRNDLGKKVDILSSSESGLLNSLRINMHIEQSEGYDFSQVLIKIHNKSSAMFNLNDGSYLLRTGTYNYFQISRVFYEKLEEPYNNCLKDVRNFKMNKTLIDYMLNLNVTYSRKECIRLCRRLFALEKTDCKCNSTYMNFKRDCAGEGSVVVEKEIKDCTNDFLNNIFGKMRDSCLEYCPEECDSIDFIISTYNEIYLNQGNITDSSKKFFSLDKYKTYEEVRNNHLRINVFFDDLKYKLISQHPKIELFNCISSIGGIFSLFLGISFISLIELFEIIIELIYVFVSTY